MKRYFPLAVVALLYSDSADAQKFPSRGIEMILPFLAGSSLDANGRVVANALSEDLGQRVVVLNRAGASGTTGFAALTRAEPDGYVIGYGPTTPIASAPFLLKDVNYKVDSFTYVCQVFETVFLIAVGPNSKISSAADLFAAAKTKPGEMTYGTAGVGGISHLSLSHLSGALGLAFQHVPYRGEAAIVPALLQGDLDFAIVTVGTLITQPRLRTLAVFADKRHPAYPNVPTARELGSGDDDVPPAHIGLFAPRNLPEPVQMALEKACESALGHEAVKRAAVATGQTVKYLSGAQFEKQTIADYKLKGNLIRRMGLAVN